jgi:hypothetical protein
MLTDEKKEARSKVLASVVFQQEDEGIFRSYLMNADDFDYYANTKRQWLLVEQDVWNNEAWYNTYETIEDAKNAAAASFLETESRMNPALIVDLDTGTEYEVDVSVKLTELTKEA